MKINLLLRVFVPFFSIILVSVETQLHYFPANLALCLSPNFVSLLFYMYEKSLIEDVEIVR